MNDVASPFATTAASLVGFAQWRLAFPDLFLLSDSFPLFLPFHPPLISAGYEIRNTLVTDMSPDNKVKASMNEINASRRLKEAASHKAEAEKVKQVKAAEAEAEAR